MTKAEKLILDNIGILFEIDKQGRIWRIARRYNAGGARGGLIATRKITRKRAEIHHCRGYFSVSMCVNYTSFLALAHRIVWRYFFGEIPEELEINHKNGIKTDNRPENLEVITHVQNIHHGYNIGLTDNRGERHPHRKLTDLIVIAIREKYARGKVSQRELAKEYKVSYATIKDIVHGELWKHIGGPRTFKRKKVCY